jgi:hypothetical protein
VIPSRGFLASCIIQGYPHTLIQAQIRAVFFPDISGKNTDPSGLSILQSLWDRFIDSSILMDIHLVYNLKAQR